MNLRDLSKDELKNRIEQSVVNERKSIRQVVEEIAEVDRRKLFFEWGFDSLFNYLTRHLKYSEAAAYRRMQAARALTAVPELKQELENGNLNLTQIALAQSAFKQEEKATGQKVTNETKKLVFAELREKTKSQTEKVLHTHLPAADPTPLTCEKHKSDDSVVITVTLSREAYQKLQKAKELYGHIVPDGNWANIIEKMSDDTIAKRDPARKVREKQLTQGFAAAEVRSPKSEAHPPSIRQISSAVRRLIFQRDQCCQQKLPSGTNCRSRFQLEIDHIQPIYAGGSNEIGNLRLVCRSHNQYRYLKQNELR